MQVHFDMNYSTRGVCVCVITSLLCNVEQVSYAIINGMVASQPFLRLIPTNHSSSLGCFAALWQSMRCTGVYNGCFTALWKSVETQHLITLLVLIRQTQPLSSYSLVSSLTSNNGGTKGDHSPHCSTKNSFTTSNFLLAPENIRSSSTGYCERIVVYG